jgi:hypothetical protein
MTRRSTLSQASPGADAELIRDLEMVAALVNPRPSAARGAEGGGTGTPATCSGAATDRAD